MELLYAIEGVRTPVLDEIFSLITHLGEETVFIVIGMVFFWCINKREGYYLLIVGLVGTVLNQFMKLLCRIPRPWVRDKNFTIVESARAEADGYSFPSGHTQTAVGSFAGIARWNKNLIIRIVCIVLAVLVGFSRMYLGVHTPADVLVGAAMALVLVFAVYPLVRKASEKERTMRIVMAVMLAIGIGYLLFVELYPFPADIDTHSMESGAKRAYTMLGCIVGLWLTFELDTRFIKFDTKAVWWAQILKLVIGIIPVMAIKILLKQPLYAIFGEGYLADGIRYFLLTAVAGAVWPLTFKWFGKMGKKKS